MVTRKVATLACVLASGVTSLSAQNTFAESSEWGTAPQTNRFIVHHRDTGAVATQGDMTRVQIQSAQSARISSQVQQDVQFVRTTEDGYSVYQLNDMLSNNDVESMTATLSADPDILFAEPDYIMQIKRTPNDSRYSQQWHYFENTGGMNLPAAWDITTGSEDVVVAVLDTGVLPHADLRDNLLPGYDFISDARAGNDGDGRDDDASDAGDATYAGQCGNGFPRRDEPSSWHGTHVAGTIAAVGNNGTGVTGVSWNSKILPVRVLGICGGYTSDIAAGMRWAAGLSVPGVPANPNPAKILNMSLGGTAPCSRSYRQAIADVRTTGATIVVAAGNESHDASRSTPANCGGVLVVGATDRNGGQAYYSNYGSTVDVSAPGGELSGTAANAVLSTHNSGSRAPGSDSYSYQQGTSMATPHVAGAAALLYSVNPDLTGDRVREVLMSTARSFPVTNSRDQCSTSLCGTGIVDVEAALLEVGATTNPDPDPDPVSAKELSNGDTEANLSGAARSELHYTLEIPEGATNLVLTLSGGTGDADLYLRKGQKPTANDWDNRSYESANNERIEIAEPEAGTYFVMVRGYAAYSGASLSVSFDAPATDAVYFENTDNVQIPDNSSQGARSTIEVTRSGASGTVSVSVDIRHTYRQDLTVRLIAPTGARATLVDKEGGSADNLTRTFSVNAGDVPAQGTWTLEVVDSAAQDTGYINSWNMTFE